MTLAAVLIAFNVLLCLVLAWRFCISRAGLEINHVLMFSLGYLVYWILPLGVGVAGLLRTEPVMQPWYRLFDTIPQANLVLYLLIAPACYLSFWAGSIWVRSKVAPPPRDNPRSRRLFFYSGTLNLPLGAGLILGAIYAVRLRGELFTGYTSGTVLTQETPDRSTFVAVSVFLLSLALTHAAKRDELRGFVGQFRSLILTRYFAAYFLIALLVLSLGGRLYFISGLIMLLAYRSVYFQRIPGRAALWLGLGAMVFAATAGLLRQNGDRSAGAGLLNLLIEPMYTSFSLIYFLSHSSFEWVRFPIFLLSSFINLIPSALLPNKAELILDPSAFGIVMYTPGGALNSFFSFMINFGVLGTMAALFVFGFGLSWVRLRDRMLLYRVTYVMLTGWLGFTFFRDPFSISLIKTMLQFSILTPLVLVIGAQLISVALRSAARPASGSSEVPS